MRGATSPTCPPRALLSDFNPRAPCGARLIVLFDAAAYEQFQPTRPLRGATIGGVLMADLSVLFQPTRPLRGATASATFPIPTQRRISTHAPLAGRDSPHKNLQSSRKHFNPRAPCGARHPRPTLTGTPVDFNPRAPCGARLFLTARLPCCLPFQPTRPLRGATRPSDYFVFKVYISTHAPLAGRDHGRFLFDT